MEGGRPLEAIKKQEQEEKNEQAAAHWRKSAQNALAKNGQKSLTKNAETYINVECNAKVLQAGFVRRFEMNFRSK